MIAPAGGVYGRRSVDGDGGPVLAVAATYLAVAVLGGVLVAATVRASARVSQAILLDLRRRVFRHTQRLSLEFHERYTSGRIISRQTSDLDAVRELLDGGVTTLAAGVLSMVLTAVSLASPLTSQKAATEMPSISTRKLNAL